MNERRMITLPANYRTAKKKVTIHGEIMGVIHAGSPARIREKHADRVTSPVIRVLERHHNCVVFETQNTLYTVKGKLKWRYGFFGKNRRGVHEVIAKG